MYILDFECFEDKDIIFCIEDYFQVLVSCKNRFWIETLLQMLDYTTEIPQRNTVPLWNLYASTTVQSYRCGMSKIQQRVTVPLWNIQDSTTVL
jgi:hypothetical protein